MKRHRSPLARALLIPVLGIMLLSQLSGLHMHIGQTGHADSQPGHIVDLQDIAGHRLHVAAHADHDDSRGDSNHAAHHHEMIDVSADYLIQKSKVSESLFVVAFLVSLLFVVPRLIGGYGPFRQRHLLATQYLRLTPPLRAPPAH